MSLSESVTITRDGLPVRLAGPPLSPQQVIACPPDGLPLAVVRGQLMLSPNIWHRRSSLPMNRAPLELVHGVLVLLPYTVTTSYGFPGQVLLAELSHQDIAVSVQPPLPVP